MTTTDPFDDFLADHPHAGLGLPRAEQEFRRKVDECAAWVAEHGRMPRSVENAHGRLLSRIRAGGVVVDADRRAYLDAALPGWDAPMRGSDDYFYSQVDGCAAWVAENGKLPRGVDRPWGRWLLSLRKGKATLSPERRAYLDRTLCGWGAPGPASDETLFAKIDECAAWVEQHGRMPKRSDASWGQWLSSIRARGDNLTPDRIAYLDRVLPGWNAPARLSDEAFFARVDGCASWVRQHGRMPKSGDKPWSAWLTNVRSGKVTVNSERRAYLDQHLPDWDFPDPKSDEVFFAKVDECAVWVAEHGRLPGGTEKPLGSWLKGVRRGRRASSLAPERRAYLNQHLPGWDASRRDQAE